MMSRLWQDFRPFLALPDRQARRRLLAGAALAALTGLMGMALLGLSGWFITATALAGLSTVTALAFDVFMPSAAIRLFALGRTAARYGERLVTHDATLAVLAALRERLFRAWSAAGAARALALRPARILFRLTADVDALDTLYLRLIVPLCTGFIAALAAGITLAFISPLLGLAVFAVLILSGSVMVWRISRSATPATLRRAALIEGLRSGVIDLASGQTELLMAGQLPARCADLGALETRLATHENRLNRIETGAGIVFGVIAALLPPAVLVAAAMSGIGAPGVALALLVAMAASETLAPLRRGALDLARTRLAVRRIGPGLAPPDPSVIPPSPKDGVAVCLHHVTLRHDGAATAVLGDISLEIRQGEHIALTGPSGIGKTSLLQCLAGEIAPQSGEVFCLPSARLTERTELFHDSLRGNLRLAAPDADDAELIAALTAAGLESLFDSLPDGLDTMLGDRGQGLSGGQARRLALARMILRNAPVWLLDEPTEGLDGQTARDVLARLHRAKDQKAKDRTTVVTATHTRREAENADRILVLGQGGILAIHIRGSPGFDAALTALRPD